MRKHKRTNLSLEPTHHSHTQQLFTNKGQDPDQDWSFSSYSSSLHAFPVELLTRIFTFYKEALDNPRLSYPPLLLITHICRRWRTIALSHGQLWTFITRGLSLRWIKAFMERSQTMLMDFDIQVAPVCPGAGTCHHHEDIVSLLANFTRVRSFCLTGNYDAIFPIVDSLRSSLPVQSFSLCLERGDWSRFILPDDLFGGQAPIRRLQLVGGNIVAPHWLLRGVTHFTTAMPLSSLLHAFRHMSALTYLELLPRSHHGRLDVDEMDTLPIQMPQLMMFVFGSNIPEEFILLNRLLLLPVGAKRRVELCVSQFVWLRYFFFHLQINSLSKIAEAANGFQHILFSGAQDNYWFRLWTGNSVTWEEAEFCISVEWRGSSREDLRFLAFSLGTLCDQLRTARVPRLVVDIPSPTLPVSCWWTFLRKLPGIKELELYHTSVDTLGGAWKINLAPAVLPALRRVRIVDSESDDSSPQYVIIGDPPARRIVRLQSSTEDQAEDGVSVEKEIENMSKGLLRLLRGLGRNPDSYSKKRKRRRG